MIIVSHLNSLLCISYEPFIFSKISSYSNYTSDLSDKSPIFFLIFIIYPIERSQLRLELASSVP